MKKLTKLCSMVLALVMFGGIVACGGSEPGPVNPDTPGKPTESLYKSYLAEKELEKDFVYMWNEMPISEGRNVCFQTESYAMLMNGASGQILNLGHYKSRTPGKYTQQDFSALPAVETTFSIFDMDGNAHKARVGALAPHVVSSGRYLQLLNQKMITYKGLNEVTSRMEIAAFRDHFTIVHEAYPENDEATTIDLQMSLGLTGFTGEPVYDGRGLLVTDSNGEGFVFMKPRDAEFDLSFENDAVVVLKSGVQLEAKKYHGFSLMVFPVTASDMSVTEAFLMAEDAELSVYSTAPQPNGATLTYDAKYGVYRLNTDGLRIGGQDKEENRQTYELVEFGIQNISTVPISPTIIIEKNETATGVSFLLRDRDSKMPTGEPVQISKDWHTQNPNERLYGGRWIMSAMHFDIQPETLLERELVSTQGMWGTSYAASHAQLSLVGYSGVCEVWDQSAMGAWGESVTYDPNIGLNRSMIDDVRPFLVYSHRQNKEGQWRWTGNVGGADFFRYFSAVEGEEGDCRIGDQKITYKTQSPCLTHVNYSGITFDKRIATDITINMGRTSDIVRNYYTMKFTFLDDVEYGRLSFFQLCADGYCDNNFQSYALGDQNGVKEEGKTTAQVGPIGEFKSAENNEFWFALYNSSNRFEETSDVMFTVRNYKAVLNGKTYDKPAYRLSGIADGAQVACEVGVPAEVKKIEKGSVVELTIEYDVLPNIGEDYYGDSEYILQTPEIFGTTEAMMQQVLNGKQTAVVEKGTLVGNYPLTIAMNNGEQEIAYKLTGGLGHVPMRFTNLDGYDYKLQQNVNGEFVDVDQSVHGNDFWQTYYDANTGTYEMVFNVPNTEGTNYLTENEYRLVKIA